MANAPGIALPYPTDLSEREWAVLAPLLPPSKPGGRPRTVDLRAILNGIFHVLRSGCQWRLLPREYGPWSTIYGYFRAWRLDGTWERIHHTLRERLRQRLGRQPTPSAAIIDSQSVKTHRAWRAAWVRRGQEAVGAQTPPACRYPGLSAACPGPSCRHSGPRRCPLAAAATRGRVAAPGADLGRQRVCGASADLGGADLGLAAADRCAARRPGAVAARRPGATRAAAWLPALTASLDRRAHDRVDRAQSAHEQEFICRCQACPAGGAGKMSAGS
jgi:transposase